MDITLCAVFDFVPEHIHRLYRHVPLGLVNGGQVDAGEGRGADVIETDEAQMSRNINAHFICRRHHA